MKYDDVLDMRERAAHCLHYCEMRGTENCFECENQVALKEIIELCDAAEMNNFN